MCRDLIRPTSKVFINNKATSSATITSSAPYTSTITDFNPIKSVYVTTDIPIASESSGGLTNLLKQIIVHPSNTYLYTDDASKHGVACDGKSRMTELKFKLTDSYGNAIDLESKDWHFVLVKSD